MLPSPARDYCSRTTNIETRDLHQKQVIGEIAYATWSLVKPLEPRLIVVRHLTAILEALTPPRESPRAPPALQRLGRASDLHKPGRRRVAPRRIVLRCGLVCIPSAAVNSTHRSPDSPMDKYSEKLPSVDQPASASSRSIFLLSASCKSPSNVLALTELTRKRNDTVSLPLLSTHHTTNYYYM